MAFSNINVQAFVKENAAVYPCSDVKSTRNGYHCKWLLLQSNAGGQIDRRIPLHTSTIDSATLQHLIVTKQAYPLPPDMEDVLEAMVVWGKRTDEEWYQHVLTTFSTLMEMGNQKTRKQLFQQCVEVRVFDIIMSQMLSPRLVQAMLIEWKLCFEDLYECRTRCYYQISIRSINYMDGCVRRLMMFGVVTPYTLFTPQITSSVTSEAEAGSAIPVVISSDSE